MPATLSLALLGTIAAVGFGLAVGTVAAIRGGTLDRVAQAGAGLGLGIPNFWLAVVLVYAFALKVAIFPATGYTPLTTSSRGGSSPSSCRWWQSRSIRWRR